MRFIISTILFLTFFAFNATAQFHIPPQDVIDKAPKWAQLMYSKNPNFYEIEAAYRDFYQGKVIKKNMHTRNLKFFKRMIRYRLRTDGSIVPTTDKEYQERIAKGQAMTRTKNNSTGNWSLLGPLQSLTETNVPDANQACVYTIDQATTNPNIMYCGTEPGEVYKSTDGGDTWTNVSLNLVLPFSESAVRTLAIHPIDENKVYFIMQHVIYQTTNGGTSWTILHTLNTPSAEGLRAEKLFIHPNHPDTMMIASSDGLLRSTNGGSSWTTIFSDPTYDIEMNTASDNIFYTLRKNDAAALPEFLSSTDYGASFTIQSNGWYTSTDSNRDFEVGRIAVTAANSNRVYALLYGQAKAGDHGYIGLYRSNDGGNSWTLPNGPAGGPYSLPNHPNLASDNGLEQIDESITADGSFCELLASNTNADQLLIGGLNLWRSDDGAATFTSLGGYAGGLFDAATNTIGFHVDQQEYKMFGNETWLTTDGGIYKSTDFFSTINYEKKNNGVHSTDFWGFGSGWNQDVLIGGTFHNGVIVYNETYGAGNYLSLGGGEPSSGYVNPGENNLVYSTDVGGVIIPNSIGIPTVFSEQFIPNESADPLAEGYSDYVFHPHSYNIAYAGKEHELWKTIDKGRSFQKIHTFGTVVENFITYIHISREDPNVLFACQNITANDESKLWKSSDAGVTWTEITTLPTGVFRFMILQIDPYDASKMWIASSSFGNPSNIFKSIDGGATWTSIPSPTIADEYAITFDYIPGTNGGLYLGTNLGMYYKNDNMSTWMDFSNGLPAVSTARKSRPFYRDDKLRISSTKGMWESPFHERPSQPFAQIMVNSIDTCVGAGSNYRFVDHSMLNHQGAMWDWTFEGGTPSTASTWFADVSYSTPGTYKAILKITDNRGLSDTDTLEITVRPAMTLDITFDDFGDETSWEILDNADNVVVAGGPYEEGMVNLSETITCIGSGCFTFKIYDSLGNGICCSEGNGSYILKDNNGMVLASGGQFDDEASSSFCICKENEFVTGTIASNTFDVSNGIESDGQILSPQDVTFNAGSQIDLNAPFEVETGAQFLAQIQACMSTVNFTDTEDAFRASEQGKAFEIKHFDTNPNFILFELQLFQNELVTFEIWDTNKSTKLSEQVYKFQKTGIHHLKLDQENLPKGAYQIKVSTETYEKMLDYTKSK